MDDTYGYDRNAVYYASLTGTGLSSWTGTTSYPTSVDTLSCVSDTTYLYCVGGANSAAGLTFYSQILPTQTNTATSTETGPVSNGWTPTTNYPTTIAGEACASSSGFIYCVAGDTSPGAINSSGGGGADGTESVYFASLSSSGVGSWQNTTAYPSGSPQACVIDSGFIYCVGSSGSYYASISSSGVGSWTSTARYPLP